MDFCWLLQSLPADSQKVRQTVAPWEGCSSPKHPAPRLGVLWVEESHPLRFLFAWITLDNASTELAAVWAAQSHVRRFDLATSHHIGGGAVGTQGLVLNKHGA